MGVSREEALLAIQQALLGETSACLRAVTIRIVSDRIHFDAYFDGPVDEEDVESMSCVDTELVAAFPETFEVSHRVHRLDAPAALPNADVFVHLRRE